MHQLLGRKLFNGSWCHISYVSRLPNLTSSSAPAASNKHTDCICNAVFSGPNGGRLCATCIAAKYKPVVVPDDALWFVTAPGNFDAVNQACRDGRGELATINSESLAENNIAAAVCASTMCYIGMARNATGIAWYWLAGDTAVYSNWRPGRPDFETRTVIKISDGLWDDWGGGGVVFPGLSQCRRPVECLECPSNSDSPPGSITSTACTCNIGFSGPAAGPCSQCTAGTYQKGIGQVDSASSYTHSGTMYGRGISADIEATAYAHSTIKNLIIFVVFHDTHYKMSGVTFTDAQIFTTC